MRDAAGELTDGFHLLGLPQLFLRLLARGHLLHQFGAALLDALLERGGQLRQCRALRGQLPEQIVAFDVRRLARGDVGADADQGLDAAVGPPHHAGPRIDPMHRAIRPNVAVFDPVIGAFIDGPLQHLESSLPVVGVNRCLQIFEGKRLTRLPPEEAGAGIRQLEFALRQTQFERTEMSRVQRRLQQALAFGQIGEDAARQILTAAAPDRRTDDAHQRGRMKRPFEKGDIAQCLRQPNRVRIALGAAALMGQQHDGKIRPRGLTVQPVDERAQVRGLDRLVGNHRQARAAFDFTQQCGQVAANIGVISCLPDQGCSHPGVTARRRENDCAFG